MIIYDFALLYFVIASFFFLRERLNHNPRKKEFPILKPLRIFKQSSSIWNHLKLGSILTVLRGSSSSADTSKTSARKTEVLYGAEKTIGVIVQSFDRAMVGCDVWGNWAVASFILGNDSLRNALVGAKKRGLRLRYITEVTNSNISYCKELAKLVELRHFDGLKGNFGIIDGKEYLATANNLHEVKSLPHLVYSSNVPEVIIQQQLVFDTLWYKGIPSEFKIKQIENETLDLVDLIRIMYLCRDCMTPFFSKEHVNEHQKNSAHTRILEIPF